MAQLMPLPLSLSCSSKMLIGITFLVPAYLDSSKKRSITGVYMYVCYFIDLNLLVPQTPPSSFFEIKFYF